LRRKDSLRGVETAEISVRLGNYSASHFEGSALYYTSQVICKGRLTMEEIIFSLKHYWRFVDSEALELQALSWGGSDKAA
jgi:hypothetical protein